MSVIVLVGANRISRKTCSIKRIEKTRESSGHVKSNMIIGSVLSNDLAAVAPSLSDGLVLTGFTHITQYASNFFISTLLNLARDSYFPLHRFDGFNSGYVTWTDLWANQYSFFKYRYFDFIMLQRAENTKMPFTMGEILTTSPPIAKVAAPDFAGFVFVSASSDLDNIDTYVADGSLDSS